MELSSFSLLFRLIFAHFLADFILQSKGMANGKRGFQIIKKKKRQLSTAQQVGISSLSQLSASHNGVSIRRDVE